MTITSSSDAAFHSLLSRVNLLESKVNWTLGQFPLTPGEPGEPPDLTALTNAVNYIYEHSFAGSHISSPPLTYESFYDLGEASIISLTYGTEYVSTDDSYRGRNLQETSFWSQVFGTSNSNHDYPTREGTTSLARLAIGDADSANYIEANGPALPNLVFGMSLSEDWSSSSLPMVALDTWGSLYRAIFGTTDISSDAYKHTRSLMKRIKDIEAKLANHESRLNFLES